MTQAARVQLGYAVRQWADEWAIPEDWPVPESVPHNIAATYLLDVLRFWASRQQRPLFVPYNLAIRWVKERPAVGIDPDVCVLDPPPPDVTSIKSLRLWLNGHVAPQVCFEVVSDTHPYKDYAGVQERYAALGARELIVFDPLLSGPKSLGGPFSIQVWRRDDAGVFERIYAGPGPSYCETLGCWLVADDRLLRLADDRDGLQRWPTGEEFERSERQRIAVDAERARADAEQARADAEQARADAERERAQRLELERRLLELSKGHERGE